MNTPSTQPQGFAEMGLSPLILQRLTAMNIITPTPIQEKSIPSALEGRDILGIAQTGTGKTLAFGIPLLQKLQKTDGRALIILPTRELAGQVGESLYPICNALGLRTAILIGGVAMHGQIRDLRRNPHIIIATPGRLNDLIEQRIAKVSDVSVLVLDEADRMFDMGFAPQINRILKGVPKDRQTLLFSATMPDTVVKLARECMQNPLRVEVAPAGTTAENIEQGYYLVHRDMKVPLLKNIACESKGTMIVFTRTKHTAGKLNKSLRFLGVQSAEIHSNRSQAQRREALHGFKSGRYSVLVATDIAARGIDVPDIETVLNFDLPEQSDDYVHRIGRTGRAGKTGRAISFVTHEQGKAVRAIERMTRKRLTQYPMPKINETLMVKEPREPFIPDPRSRPEHARPKSHRKGPSSWKANAGQGGGFRRNDRGDRGTASRNYVG